MPLESLSESGSQQNKSEANPQNPPAAEAEKILCVHCKRTATNGIKCRGMCVADSDY